MGEAEGCGGKCDRGKLVQWVDRCWGVVEGGSRNRQRWSRAKEWKMGGAVALHEQVRGPKLLAYAWHKAVAI